MDTPCRAKPGQFFVQGLFDAPQLGEFEAVAFPQLGWALRTVQQKYGFAARAPYMDMRGAMIVGINHCAQAGKAEDGWHGPK